MPTLPDLMSYACVPAWLQQIPRWVLWRAARGKKVPISVTTGQPIDVIHDQEAGWEFWEAVQAVQVRKAAGIGIILNGDGLVAVDLDDCLTESGDLMEGVHQLLEGLGGGFVEISPSGRGLHVFGMVEQAEHTGVRRIVDDIKVELYCSARYVTVTGQALVNGPVTVGSPQIPGYMTLLAAATSDHELPCNNSSSQLTQEMQEIQDIQDIQARGGGTIAAISQMPSSCRLERAGDRNAKCFELARWLKGVAPEATLNQLRPIVKQWHQMHLDIMDTKPFSETWIDFTNAWRKVKFPYGSVLNELFAQLPELPPWMRDHDLGDYGDKLLRLCVSLDARNKGGSFLLAGHALAPFLGCSAQRTYTIIGSAIACDYIKRTSEWRRRRAAEYQLCHGLKT